MLHIALYQPEIPPNTGNIIRLAANTGAQLHRIKPLGFSIEDTQLRRAGLDYHEARRVTLHESWEDFLRDKPAGRLFAFSTKAQRPYSEVQYQKGDVVLFGPESRGLPDEIRNGMPLQQVLRVPMREGSRSLNLSNTVAVVVYEALRQQGFAFGD